jgi:hypothetical protein
MPAVPSSFAQNYQIGLLIGLACSGRLVPPDLVVAMSMQHNPVHLSSGYLMIKGKPVEVAREMIADAALEHGARFLWFVDDDTIPPPNACRRLIYELENNPQAMVCGGIYTSRCDPPSPVVFRGLGMGSHWHWKKGDVFEVSGMGAGCMMINTEIFKMLPKPWFKFDTEDAYDVHTVGKNISEDIYFCEAVRREGYKILAHGGVLCDHYDSATGSVFSLPEDSYPMRKETPSAQTEEIPTEKEKEKEN